ncbi:MAG: Zn-dependent hydrolase [Vicinamibacterales bacterium]
MLTRRELLESLAIAPFFSPAGASRNRSEARPEGSVLRAAPAVDADRLRRRIEDLSVFGRPVGGTFDDGVSRVGYSDADIAGRRYVRDLMEKAGLSVRVDEAGNMVGRRPGSNGSLPAILFGSHIDSVPGGGNFDGALGTLAAIEVVEALGASGTVTRHPLEVVVWANEEGVAFGNGLCGSRAATGHLEEGELEHVWNGMTKAEAIRRIGGDPSRIGDARRRPGSIHCYLELHVEQGGVLDRAGVPIGVVEGIVSIDRYEAVIEGRANHAGTTPMAERHDALVAAAQLTLAVREIVTAEPGRQVGTVGKLDVTPNAPNVIPGVVRHTIELRDLSPGKIAALARRIEGRARAIAMDTGTKIAVTMTSHHEAALADPRIQAAIEQAAADSGLRSMRLPSGAGHDAQMLARIAPMGMIFVPSIGGVSHSPAERTSWEHCAWGAATLLGTVVAMDRITVRS